MTAFVAHQSFILQLYQGHSNLYASVEGGTPEALSFMLHRRLPKVVQLGEAKQAGEAAISCLAFSNQVQVLH